MNFRLCNQKNPAQNLTLSYSAWMWLLDSAREAGWNPMGTIQRNQLVGLGLGDENEDSGDGSYAPSNSRLVMLEDALNLMDALERIAAAYEPMRISYRGIFRTEWDDMLKGDARPGIGSLLALADLCRAGPFLIEGQVW